MDAEISVLIDSMFSPENYGDFDCNIVSKALNDVITALPSRAKEVFTLRRENGLSNKEVADRLGVSVKAVEKQMTIALKRIKQALVHKGIPFILLLLQFILH